MLNILIHEYPLPSVIVCLDLHLDLFLILHVLRGGDGLPLDRVQTVNESKTFVVNIKFFFQSMNILFKYPSAYPAFSFLALTP